MRSLPSTARSSSCTSPTRRPARPGATPRWSSPVADGDHHGCRAVTGTCSPCRQSPTASDRDRPAAPLRPASSADGWPIAPRRRSPKPDRCACCAPTWSVVALPDRVHRIERRCCSSPDAAVRSSPTAATRSRRASNWRSRASLRPIEITRKPLEVLPRSAHRRRSSGSRGRLGELGRSQRRMPRHWFADRLVPTDRPRGRSTRASRTPARSPAWRRRPTSPTPRWPSLADRLVHGTGRA